MRRRVFTVKNKSVRRKRGRTLKEKVESIEKQQIGTVARVSEVASGVVRAAA
jgi:hypothetical protein